MKLLRFWPLLILPLVWAPSILAGEWDVVFKSLMVGLLAGLISIPLTMKANLLRATAPDEPRKTTLDEWPKVDRAAWDEIARQWRELGFEPRMVWAMGERNPRLGVSLSQLWERPEGDALCEISQSFQPRGATKVATFVVSYWGDGAALENLARALEAPVLPLASPHAAPQTAAPLPERLPIYSYTTHNRAPNWVFNLLLHPQVLGTRLSNAAPEALLQTHLARREAISQALQMEPLTGDLIGVVRAQSRVLRAGWHRRLGRGFATQLWRAWRRGTSQNETWGDLAEKLGQGS